MQAARETARRATCRNNLKQLSLGVLNHESAKKYLPTAGWGFNWVGDPDRGSGYKQPGGWAYCILPFVEETALAAVGKGLDAGSYTSPNPNSAKGTAIAQVLTTPLPDLMCPSRRTVSLYTNYNGEANAVFCPLIVRSDYAGNGGDNNVTDSTQTGQPASFADGDGSFWINFPLSDGVFIAHGQMALSMITDGTSKTYLLGEKYLQPENYYNGQDLGDNENVYTGLNFDNIRTTALGPSGNSFSYQPPYPDTPGYNNVWCWGSAHLGSFNMSFCDGSVQIVNYEIDPELHRRLSHRDDNLAVDLSQM